MLAALFCFVFFFQAEDGIRDGRVTGVQTCALPISAVGALATGVAWGAGLLEGPAPWVALVACLPLATVLVLCAAIAGHRGRVSPGTLATAFGLGELGGPVYLLGWVLLGPLLAEAVLTVTAGLVVQAAPRPGALPGAVVGAALLLSAVLGAQLAYV